MDLILDKSILKNVIERSKSIQESTPQKWGKMNASQMFQHLNKSLEFVFTDKSVRRMFIGRIIGKFILKKALKNHAPLSKNSPTAPTFVAANSANFTTEKEAFINKLIQFKNINESDLEGKIHPFFGKMTGNQWNVLIHKHIEHHLKQFNA